jgi:hypothetical protein
MCTFAAPWFGASYPDGQCIDGYMHDMDADGYDPNDTSFPCPKCNTREFLERRKEHCDATEYEGHGTGFGMVYRTGDQMWETAKTWARQEAPDAAEKIISELEVSQ